MARGSWLCVVMGIFFILFPRIVYAQDFSQLQISATEKCVYQTINKKTGKVIWQAFRSVNKMEKDNLQIVTISEQGRGNYNNALEDLRWVVESRINFSPRPLVLDVMRTAYSSDSKELWRKNKIFDYSHKRLIAEHFNDSQLTKRKSIPLPSGSVFTSEILPLILRGYDFEAQKPYSFYIFSWDAKLFKMQARRIDKEIVRTPAGEFECYKIEISPALGFVDIVSRYIIPKTYLWFTVKEPHFWVKYEGLETGFASPYVVMEITEFKGQKE